jgi:SAM-dependent methyltransferase
VTSEQPITAPNPGQRGISERLRRFTNELPFERRPILDFVSEVARTTAAGAAVLDLGAGDAPYRELFTHVRYVTSDWTHSPHRGAAETDIVGAADALPVADGSFELVLCTQVLEHVPAPADVLAECFRILVAGGRIAITVPMLWELHELPHDYWRYTPAGLERLLAAAGFVDFDIQARGDGFGAVAQLMRNLRWAMGDADDGLNNARIEARSILCELSDSIAALSALDARQIMPLGYSALARRP